MPDYNSVFIRHIERFLQNMQLCAMLHYLGTVSTTMAIAFVAVIGTLSLARLILVFAYRRSKVDPAVRDREPIGPVPLGELLRPGPGQPGLLG